MNTRPAETVGGPARPQTGGASPSQHEVGSFTCVHSGTHVFVVAEHPVVPVASNADKVRSVLAYTTPLATAGVAPAADADVHSGVHVLGVPEHPVVPVASNAYNRSDPT